MADSRASTRLVVNADGFGLSAARNRGILVAHRDGIVTSTSVLGNAPEVAATLAELAAAPRLGSGLLLMLTGGSPIAPPAQVPSLVGADGKFPDRERDVLAAWAKATLASQDIEREFDAQITRWRTAGLRIDHLCMQDGIGALPVVAAAAEGAARRHGVAGLRTAVERPTLAWTADIPRAFATAAMGVFAWYNRRQMGALRHGPQTWGHFEHGRLDEIRLLEILGRLSPGSHELLCTPDLNEAASPDGEVAALTSDRVRHAVVRRGVELCRWSDLV